jgi:FHA domain-containing protein
MHLVIRAQSIQDEALSPAIECTFDERGGTIGRSEANTLTLPDPERHVSRLQGEVLFRDGRFWVRNVGNANPLVLNGRAMHAGETATLQQGDAMVIGGYALMVTLPSASDTAALQGAVADARTVIRASARDVKTTPPRAAHRPSLDARAARQNATDPARATPPQQQHPATLEDPFADLLGDIGAAPMRQDNPFADLLQPATPNAAASPRAAAPIPRQVPSPRAATLPNDFDPFADPAEGDTTPSQSLDPLRKPAFDVAKAGAHSTTDLLAGLGGSATGSIDELFGLSANDKALGAGFDPFAAAAPSASPVAEPNHVPDLASAYRPPEVRQAWAPSPPSVVAPVPVPVPTATPRAAPKAPSPADSPSALPDSTLSTTDADLLSAFCQGAGVALPGTQHLTPELMQLIGTTLRHAVDGTVQLIGVRTTAKQALRAQVTTIQSKHNNPLKFAPDAATALKQLLGPPVRGFMAAPDAMQDAMVDLLGHAVGTMAGTQAALQSMLQRFEPQQLEQQLSDGGLLSRLVPAARQAKLWELYLQHHQRISESAREDFHEVFGKAFVQAYEAEADRVADHMAQQARSTKP